MDGEEKAVAKKCELCSAAAAVYCANDAAFLCFRCDSHVHKANFLASRHHRRLLVHVIPVTCEQERSSSQSSFSSSTAASSCVSTAESSPPPPRRRRTTRKCRTRAGATLEAWGRSMGLSPSAARRRAILAVQALSPCGEEVAAARLPVRVAMASALWSEIAHAAASGSTCLGALLRHLEASTHVPARVILAVASGFARARRRDVKKHQEGWAEC